MKQPIYQSSNKSLSIDVKQYLSSMPEVNVTLNLGEKELKNWVWLKSEADEGVDQNIHLDDMKLTLDFTQAETAAFPTGHAIIDIKYLDTSGVTQFYEFVQVDIKRRYNTHEMGVS